MCTASLVDKEVDNGAEVEKMAYMMDMEVDKVADKVANMKWKLSEKWNGVTTRDVSPVVMFIIIIMRMNQIMIMMIFFMMTLSPDRNVFPLWPRWESKLPNSVFILIELSSSFL